ncbi:hypothetical protein QOZ80_6AG0529950 [Eleusine coracana subsp. coracana]|nr:hypothetical protein QOZ80_6AG0529950 [Eleusine coracana subsp. coracana]
MGSSRLLMMALAVLAVAFLAGAGVASAARPAPGSGDEAVAAAEYLALPAAVVEKAREAVETLLLARLPAGSSPRGPGH